MKIRPILQTDLKTSIFYVWLRLDGVYAVAGGGPKYSNGRCLRSDRVLLDPNDHSISVLWNKIDDMIDLFPASFWGLIFGQNGAISI